jgi:hypothetical protein
VGDKPAIEIGGPFLAIAPWNMFNPDTAVGALNPSHGIGKKDEETPDGNKLKPPYREGVIVWSFVHACGTNGARAFPGANSDHDSHAPLNFFPML